MKVVVVGGHTRNIGKTSVMAALIREFAPLGWSAVKITQYGHGVCSHDGHACECAPQEHPFAVTEERDPQGRADTSRFLAAGARRSLWLRARQGQLAPAVPLLRRKLGRARWVVIESNSILEFIDPLLYIAVLDTSRADFKASARRWLSRAHALITVENGGETTRVARQDNHSGRVWTAFDAGLPSKPTFPVRAPEFWSASLTDFFRERIRSAPDVLSDAPKGVTASEDQTWPH